MTLAKALDQQQHHAEQQQAQLATLAQAQQHKDRGVEVLQQQVTDLLQQQQRDQAELDTRQQQLAQQQQDLELRQEQEAAATMAVHDVTARLDRNVRQLAEVQQAKDMLQHAHWQLQREVEVLRNRAELTPVEVTLLNNTLQQREQELEASSTLHATLEERCQALQRHNQDLQETCQDWEQEHQAVLAELHTVQSQLDEARTEQKQLAERYQRQAAELTTAVANTQDDHRRQAQQQRFAIAQCHRDVLDTLQALSPADRLAEQSLPETETTVDQVQRLRTSVEQLKQHVLWQHRSLQGETRELSDQSQGLQVCVWHETLTTSYTDAPRVCTQTALRAKQQALDLLQHDLHERSLQVQTLHSELAQQQQDHEQSVRDYRRQAQATQQLLSESEVRTACCVCPPAV